MSLDNLAITFEKEAGHTVMQALSLFSPANRELFRRSHAPDPCLDARLGLPNYVPCEHPSHDQQEAPGIREQNLLFAHVLAPHVRIFGKDQFKELGDEAAANLEQIGAEKLTSDGKHLTLELRGDYLYPSPAPGIADVKLSSKVECDLEKNKDYIELRNVKGVQVRIGTRIKTPFGTLDSTIPIGVPNVRINRTGIELGPRLPVIPAPGLFDKLNELSDRIKPGDKL